MKPLKHVISEAIYHVGHIVSISELGLQNDKHLGGKS